MCRNDVIDEYTNIWSNSLGGNTIGMPCTINSMCLYDCGALCE